MYRNSLYAMLYILLQPWVGFHEKNVNLEYIYILNIKAIYYPYVNAYMTYVTGWTDICRGIDI